MRVGSYRPSVGDIGSSLANTSGTPEAVGLLGDVSWASSQYEGPEDCVLIQGLKNDVLMNMSWSDLQLRTDCVSSSLIDWDVDGRRRLEPENKRFLTLPTLARLCSWGVGSIRVEAELFVCFSGMGGIGIRGWGNMRSLWGAFSFSCSRIGGEVRVCVDEDAEKRPRFLSDW